MSELKVSVRPTLIVGVGGTGTMVCQEVHRLLSEEGFAGGMPPFIRVAAIDTDAQEEGSSHLLPEEDFFNLFEDMELGAIIRDFDEHQEFHPHLDWLKGMQLDAGTAGCGCQGLNRLGRVVFFELRERIHQAMLERLGPLNDFDSLHRMMEPFADRFNLSQGSGPLIHIAASVCGGTGAGMIIDLAYNLRKWANDEFHRKTDIIAHLVLPDAVPVSSERIRDKLRTVASATLEQIEYLMDSKRPAPEVRYRNGSGLRFEKLTAPFDYVYLLNRTSPGHGTDRKELTELIGRMIRAMSAEPASKPILSDANNKQNDVLSVPDEATGRKLCFASYGLRYGTPGGAVRADGDSWKKVAIWLLDDLRSFAHDSSSTLSTTQFTVTAKHRLKEAVRVDRWTALLDNENVEITNIASGNSVVERVRKTLSRWLTDIAPAIIDRPIAKKLQEQPILAELLEAIRHELEETLASKTVTDKSFVEKAHLLVAEWNNVVRSTYHQYRNSSHAEYGSIAKNVEKIILNDLIQRSGSADLSGMFDDELRTQIIQGLKDNFEALAKPLIHRRLLDQLREAAAGIRHAHESFVDLGQQVERIMMDVGKPSAGNQRDAYFALPLFKLSHPRESDDATRNRYHQRIVSPFLRRFFDEISAHTEIPSTKPVEDLAESILNSQREDYVAFLEFYQKALHNSFHQRLNGASPHRHRFYDSVRKVDEMTEAQLSINQKHRSADTLNVAVAQYPMGCCVEDLLSRNQDRDLRKALLPDHQEHAIWLQMHKFKYGFCLPGLDEYEQYLEARERHLSKERSRFSEVDFWLDPQWYQDYKFYLDEVGKHATGTAGGDGQGEEGQQSGGEWSATIAELAKLFEHYSRRFAAVIEDEDKAFMQKPGMWQTFKQFQRQYDSAPQKFQSAHGATIADVITKEIAWTTDWGIDVVHRCDNDQKLAAELNSLIHDLEEKAFELLKRRPR
jgi:hypothetical protein